ncbi:MAG TPA: DUF5677 domain-containing protein [Candidatus Binataceae bacterium]|nr:DUF5677 domain-containing protein [Candidatus Binataceae bacterium]
MSDAPNFSFGSATEQAYFAETHRPFLERFSSLKAALEIAFVRKETAKCRIDVIIFYLGRLCVEDFMEVLLLCANGYGVGATKLLRGMYERLVTARYLCIHPAEIDNFLDFHWVDQYRLAQAIEKVFPEGTLDNAKLTDLKSRRDAALPRFMVTDCKKCGTKRPNYTWSKLDFVSMARATGPTGDRIVEAYYLPTQRAHSTVAAVLKRLTEKEGGSLISFDSGAQRKDASTALITAHNLIINVLDLQKDHFKLSTLDAPLQKCLQDFQEIWTRTDEASDRRTP